MGYKNITKPELIEILEFERAEHDTTKRGLEKMAKQYERMNDLVTAISADLHLAERTIARLMIDETIRQEWEADHG